LPRLRPLTSAPYQLDRVAAVELGDEDVDPVAGPGAHRGPDDVSLDRQLPAAAVNQDAEQDPPRPAEVGALIQRGAHRAAGVEHVVHDHDRAAVEVGQARLAHDGSRPDGLQIVAVEGDVELSAGNTGAFGLVDEALEAVGQLDAAPLDADQHQVVGSAPALDDFGGHAHQRSAERALIEEGGPRGHRGGKLVSGVGRRNSRCHPERSEGSGQWYE